MVQWRVQRSNLHGGTPRRWLVVGVGGGVNCKVHFLNTIALSLNLIVDFALLDGFHSPFDLFHP